LTIVEAAPLEFVPGVLVDVELAAGVAAEEKATVEEKVTPYNPLSVTQTVEGGKERVIPLQHTLV
jgi:hypothetical protein